MGSETEPFAEQKAIQPFLQWNSNTGVPGKRVHRNRRHRLGPMRMGLCSVDLRQEVDHLTLLARLGSNTDHKFQVSKLLRSSSVTTSFLFYLVRLSPHLDAWVRPRATNQLRSIFRFRGTSVPPQNKFLRVLQTSADFVGKVKRWMTSFAQDFFSAQFPPYHLPKAQITEVSDQTLGQVLLNHRHGLQQKPLNFLFFLEPDAGMFSVRLLLLILSILDNFLRC